jgi:hypothetical protein
MTTHILNLEPGDYYTQRNNPAVYGDNPRVDGDKDFLLRSSSQCMGTTYVMFLIGNKISFDNPTNLPDDAYFGKLLITREAWEFAAKKYPWSINRTDNLGNPLPDIPPNEIHGMYGSYLSPIVCGRRVSDFATGLSFGDYLKRIDAGEVIMTSGRFPGVDGHAFLAAGTILSPMETVISLADPWGDFRTGYRSHKGYGIPMSQEEFITHVKPEGKTNKWGHVKI